MMGRMGYHNVSWIEKHQCNITGGTTVKKNEGADSWKDKYKAEEQNRREVRSQRISKRDRAGG